MGCDIPPGVVTGDNLLKLLTHARENGYAIPAFNCTRYVRTLSYVLVLLLVLKDTREDRLVFSFKYLLSIDGMKRNGLKK